MRFVDTNILIYAVSADSDDVEKRRRSLDLLAASDLALSVQVLQEFYVQATRASRPGALTHDEAVAFTEALQRFRVQANHSRRDERRVCDPRALRPFLLGQRHSGRGA